LNACHWTIDTWGLFALPADGTDDGNGVLSKLNGPVVIRFFTDDKPGFAVRVATFYARTMKNSPDSDRFL
jgi:hypothetical protein